MDSKLDDESELKKNNQEQNIDKIAEENQTKDLSSKNLIDSINEKLGIVSDSNEFTIKDGKVILKRLMKEFNGQKLNLLDIKFVTLNGKIDINKICNDIQDDKVDFFKFTKNLLKCKIDLGIITDSSGDKINVYRLNELINEHGALDLSRVTDSSLNGKILSSKINLKCNSEKYKKIMLDSFTDSDNCGKFDLFKLYDVILNEKIDINKICNTADDDNVNLFKFTTNLKKGQIDLAILTDSSSDKINMYRLSGSMDEKGRMDLSKITDSRLDGIIDIQKLDFTCYNVQSKRYMLDHFTDSENGNDGKINLFKLKAVVLDRMIDINTICNRINDNNVDLFQFTRNLTDGQIDLAILTDSGGLKIDVYRLKGLIDDKARLDLAKITDSGLDGMLHLDRINFKCFDAKSNKYYLTAFTDSKKGGNIDLFKIFNVLRDNKIDITKIQNSAEDTNLDILGNTIHKLNGKVLIDSFRNGAEKYIYLSSFNGMTTEDCFSQSENVGKFITNNIDGKKVTGYECFY